MTRFKIHRTRLGRLSVGGLSFFSVPPWWSRPEVFRGFATSKSVQHSKERLQNSQRLDKLTIHHRDSEGKFEFDKLVETRTASVWGRNSVGSFTKSHKEVHEREAVNFGQRLVAP